MTEQNEPTCGYCAHPANMHIPVGCWGEARALNGGWRTCTCRGYVEKAA